MIIVNFPITNDLSSNLCFLSDPSFETCYTPFFFALFRSFSLSLSIYIYIEYIYIYIYIYMFPSGTLVELSEIGILPLLSRHSAKFPRKSRRIVDLRRRAKTEERR